MKFLAESCGADLTIKNGMGCSPLWIAAGYNRIDCLEYLVESLSKRGDDALLDANDTGDSAFLAAASKGYVDICKYLLTTSNKDETKAKLLRTVNKSGDSPLKVAVAGGHDVEILKVLLEADASLASDNYEEKKCINKKNKFGLSPLIIACERNLPSVVDLLIKFDADVNIRDSKGRHALAVAAFCGCDDVVRFLLQQMKESPAIALLLNEKDESGCTPLWLAARTGNLKMVELLIEAGADKTLSDNEGLTPHAVASKFNKEKVEQYLQQHQTSNQTS